MREGGPDLMRELTGLVLPFGAIIKTDYMRAENFQSFSTSCL